MNEECGDGLKGFQFFRPHHVFGEPKVQQTHCNLIAHALQQIQFFNRVGNATHAICQDDHAYAAISCP